ncbi:anhydro-N-acetylmuramic acid kinase [Methylophilus aquaticus]|uniref:Anhydro-N-acetylmuramic acid kinase n=1 Tax=Methylophilus aquaticus TaxID=1971610 RepID=A0ABT9JPT0_9PROT|nr:anhydro-N-acetylmuramic acid kinase [Methylophilus aquaticus]MDP8566484.1 anhydro-N-acetylmuramic acid kinase [Methylophilus aquaticus]
MILLHAMNPATPLHSRYFIGMMSGTSLDGVDTVLVQQSVEGVRQLAEHFLPYPENIKQTLLALHHPAMNELHEAAITANALARLYAESVHQLLAKAAIPASAISAIGCHGQTIRHCPDLQDGLAYTSQIGNLARLAELTNISVVGDFRSRDIAAGGQGAPLVPAFHQAVFAHATNNRAIINIGGIANISWLPAQGAVTGFDSGPGNMLLDQWINQHTGKPYDADGAFSACGTVNNALLQAMLAEPYLQITPPKSTGRDLFNQIWLTHHLQQMTDTPQNVARTLLEFTALTIADAIHKHCPDVHEIFVCGGGVHNGMLMSRIAAALHMPVQKTEELGIGADWVEAVAFAWLAQRCVDGLSGNLPAVTGAAGPRILGAIYPA